MTFPQIQQYLGRTIAWSIRLLCLILALRFFVIDPGLVNGQSMEPTFSDNQYFLVNRFIYLLHPPRRYDIIQLYDKDTDQSFIKRVIGLPGETVMLRHDGVYVELTSGETIKLEEDYLYPDMRTAVQPGQRVSFNIGSNSYYVLGDNRRNSNDSREFGTVHRRYIQGQVLTLFD